MHLHCDGASVIALLLAASCSMGCMADESVGKITELDDEEVWTEADDAPINQKLDLQASPQEIVELSDNDFGKRIKEGTEGPWFVKFYAPWCGHCKKLAPKWEELAVQLTGIVRVAQVNVVSATRLTREFDITGVPRMKLIINGSMYNYEGKHDVNAMLAWATGGYFRGQAQKIPSRTTVLDKVIDVGLNFIKFVGLIHKAMPLLIPFLCMSCLVLGLLFTWIWKRCTMRKPPDEVFDVQVSRDAKELAGFAINSDDMTVMSVERPELAEQIQIGDWIMAVNGTSVTDAAHYRSLAHGVKSFAVTFGRHNPSKPEAKKEK